jgi:PAS domain S-box-containing protein
MNFLFESVLLIEDEPAHALLVSRALKDLVRTVHQASSKKEALALLTATAPLRPSLVISDLNLPDGKELEIVEPVIAALGDIPLIVLTSSTSLATAISSMKVGARDYIVKNFGPDFKDTLALSLQRVAVSINDQRERKRLEHEMSILRLAVENGTDGVALVHQDGSISYCNTAFTELAHRLKGSTFHVKDFFEHGIVDPHLIENIIERVNSVAVWTTEVQTQKDIGLTLRLELSRLTDQESHEILSALWIRDITEIKRRERLQKEILSTTTHDLKGPLGAILLSAELITQKPELTERVKEIGLRISSSAQGAVNIIDEFLSARRLQEGALTLRPKAIAFQDLLDEVLRNVEPMMRAKSVHFHATVPQDFVVHVDKLGMVRVLGNLLSNAVKFTDKRGSVTLVVVPKDTTYTIRITDTGAGMEPQEARKLFERFSRLKRHEDIEGTGLGLYIVKAIVEAHGGIISVASALGIGTSFELLLPLDPPVNAQGELMLLDF